jgi:hypothetical protein
METKIEAHFPDMNLLDAEFGDPNVHMASNLPSASCRPRRRYFRIMLLSLVFGLAGAVMCPSEALPQTDEACGYRGSDRRLKASSGKPSSMRPSKV